MHFKRTWLQVFNYTGPWLIQVGARGKSKPSSPARKTEEAECGKCTDKRRRRIHTLDGKTSRRFHGPGALSQTMWWTATEGGKCWEAVIYSGDRPRKWKVTERLRWRKLKGASGAIAHQFSTDSNMKQFPWIFSVVFSEQAAIMLLQ